MASPPTLQHVEGDHALTGEPLHELDLRMIGSIEADIVSLGMLNIGYEEET